MTPPIAVEVHEVEHGDRLFGMITPVDQLLTDGVFWYYGHQGVVIAKRRCGTRVQVVRAQDVVEGDLTDSDRSAGRILTSPFTATSPGWSTRPPGGVAGGVDASSGASPAATHVVATLNMIADRGTRTAAAWYDPDPTPAHGIARSHGLYEVGP